MSSSTAVMYEELEDCQCCEDCGAPNAGCIITDTHGEEHRLCAMCESEVMECMLVSDGWCQHCGKEKATDVFLRLDGSKEYLCTACFGMADHLPFCDPNDTCTTCGKVGVEVWSTHQDGTTERFCGPCFDAQEHD